MSVHQNPYCCTELFGVHSYQQYIQQYLQFDVIIFITNKIIGSFTDSSASMYFWHSI